MAKKAKKAAKPARTAKKVVKKTAVKTTAKKAATKKTAAKKTARTPNSAFMRPVTPSETLAEVIGKGGMPRTEVTKKLWAYIRKHNLQDPTNRRMINADAKLKPVFGGKAQVNMFDMTRLVGMHLK